MAPENSEVTAEENDVVLDEVEDNPTLPLADKPTTSVVAPPRGKVAKFIHSEVYLVFVGILALMAFLLGLAALASNAGQDTSPAGFQGEDRGSISDRLPGFPDVDER